MEQLSQVDQLIKQGYNSKLLNDLYNRHLRRVHTHRSDDRFFPLGKPCLICDEYVVDLVTIKFRSKRSEK